MTTIRELKRRLDELEGDEDEDDPEYDYGLIEVVSEEFNKCHRYEN